MRTASLIPQIVSKITLGHLLDLVLKRQWISHNHCSKSSKPFLVAKEAIRDCYYVSDM